ncbi:MAG: universal stress protein [Alphaproteobacteria bacterium]|nr:universal stress protein [Alphaproteobacteria bacterium]
MLRSILLALDDTPGAVAARDLALALARQHGARLTMAGLSAHDDGMEPTPLGASAFAEHRNAVLAARQQAENAAMLEAARTAAGSTPFETVTLDEAPEPALLAAGLGHDLIIVGRDSTLGREACEDGLAPAIPALVRDAARPLLVVPPGWTGGEGPVLVGLSPCAAAHRTLQALGQLGLARDTGCVVHAPDAAMAGAAAGYLTLHGAIAEGLAVPEITPELLLTEARAQHARMLAVGIEGDRGIWSLLFGSPVARLLREAPCPVFIHG